MHGMAIVGFTMNHPQEVASVEYQFQQPFTALRKKCYRNSAPGVLLLQIAPFFRGVPKQYQIRDSQIVICLICLILIYFATFWIIYRHNLRITCGIHMKYTASYPRVFFRLGIWGTHTPPPLICRSLYTDSQPGESHRMFKNSVIMWRSLTCLVLLPIE